MILVSMAVFIIIRLVPGDPVLTLLGPNAEPGMIEELRNELGLNRPVSTQYLLWFFKVIQGDLGKSIVSGRGILESILERIPITFSLVFFAFLVAVVVGLPSGTAAAVHQNTKIDYLCMTFYLLGVSIPSFWLGLLLLLTFSVHLQWFPSIGFVSIFKDFYRGLQYLLLPALSLGLIESAIVGRMTRSSMLEILRQEYITTAKAKGLPARRVIWRHALKNAFGPILTVIGLEVGFLLGGAVVTETVFSLPGIGRLVVFSIYNRDYPMVQGCILFISLVYLTVSLIVDLLYGFFDPRIKYG